MTFAELEREAARLDEQVVVVAGAAGDEVFGALQAAEQILPVRFLLIGEEKQCRQMAEHYRIHPAGIIAAQGDEVYADLAVRAVADGRAGLLMKGLVSTPVLLKRIVSEKSLFESGALLSHITILEHPESRFFAVTDGGMNVTPDVEQKATIITSAIHLFHRFGVSQPKVAVLAANEKPNPKIPGSADAVDLKRRWEEGAFPESVVDGPLALDLAVSPHAAELKGYTGPVRGDADILLVSDITCGNVLGKSLVYMAGYPGAGMILGAKVPIILLSRSDSAREKYQSILLALTAGAAG